MHVYTTFCLCIHPSKDTCYYLLAIVNNAAMNIGIQISFWVPAFNFSGYLPRGGIPGSYGSCMHTHQQGTRVPVSPHLCQHLLFCFIGSSHSGCEVIAIWIYLIISDAEHLLMSLLAICISLLEKCLLLGPFFLNWIFFFFWLLTFSPSFILISRPLIYDLWIFSFILQDAFSFCWVFLLLCRKF